MKLCKDCKYAELRDPPGLMAVVSSAKVSKWVCTVGEKTAISPVDGEKISVGYVYDCLDMRTNLKALVMTVGAGAMFCGLEAKLFEPRDADGHGK